MLAPNTETNENKVLTMKMSSGEEVIARVVSEDNNKFFIKNPLMPVMLPSEDNSSQGMVAFVPWIISVERNKVISINKSNVLVYTVTSDDASKQYSIAMNENINSYVS